MIRSTTRYRNMQPVFQSLAAALPPALRSWPFQLCASQSVLERTAPERSRLLALEAQLQAELAALAARTASPTVEPAADPVAEVTAVRATVNGSANGTARRPGRIGLATASLRRAGSARLRQHR
jgi:hypothetical protein